MNDKEFLTWLRNRLVTIYKESENVDFVHRLDDYISIMPDPREAEKAARYSFCESVTAGSASPWHIRQLTRAGQKFGGGADTLSLCGRQMSWDLRSAVNPSNNYVCKICSQIYREQI